MALHLNLYHEVEKQKAISRRDPLKLAVMGLGAVAACFAGYYFYQLSVQSSIKSELTRLQNEYATLRAKADVAKGREEELSATIQLSEQLTKRIDSRFYWAPVLDILVQSVPREVQITKVAGDVSGSTPKRCSISIEGLAAGTEPRTVAESLRKTFADKFAGSYKKVSTTFKSLEDGKNHVTLDGHSLSTAAFSINVQFQSGDDPTPDTADASAAPGADSKKS